MQHRRFSFLLDSREGSPSSFNILVIEPSSLERGDHQQAGHYAVDPRHLILLKGYQLQGKKFLTYGSVDCREQILGVSMMPKLLQRLQYVCFSSHLQKTVICNIIPKIKRNLFAKISSALTQRIRDRKQANQVGNLKS